MNSPLRVVLDTNVVVSALVFGGVSVRRLRSAWQSGRIIPLASKDTAGELLRVLAYPKFRLDAREQEAFLADYMPWVEAVEIPDPPPATPRCRDALDRPFLELAIAGAAKCLVSGDADLLVLDGARGLCTVMAVDAFCAKFL